MTKSRKPVVDRDDPDIATHREIAEQVGLSISRTQQLEQQALEKVRRKLKHRNIEKLDDILPE